MSEGLKQLAGIWDNTQKKSTETTLLPTVKFDKITSAIFSSGPFYYYIIDFFDMSLSNVSLSIKDVHGFDPRLVTFNDILSTIHPDDVNFVTKIETEIVEFFYKGIGKEKLLTYKVSYSFRSKMKNGEYGLLNHQAIVLTLDTNGGFAKSINIHTDISHLSKINTYTYSLISLDSENSYMDIEPFNNKKIMNEFTKREREIIKLLSDGNDNVDIASILNLSEHTVKNHRKNILQKSDCKNTVQLIKKCMLQGLI